MTMSEIRAANRAAGFHWFDASTMRFFRSRVGETVYEGPGGVFFVSSEQFEDSRGVKHARKYTVRKFTPATGDVGTVSWFNDLSRSEATTAAKKLAKGAKYRTGGGLPFDRLDDATRHAATVYETTGVILAVELS